MLHPRTETIESWSFKEYRARYNYRCKNCGGMIVAGTQYLRHVERLGPNKSKDPLRNVHVHLDCHAPWYQPADLPHRLRQLSTLPGKLPPVSVHNPAVAFLHPQVAVTGDRIGTAIWKLPEAIAQKIAFCPSPIRKIGAVGEIEQALSIVLLALTQSAGNKRKSLILSHHINEIAASLV